MRGDVSPEDDGRVWFSVQGRTAPSKTPSSSPSKPKGSKSIEDFASRGSTFVRQSS